MESQISRNGRTTEITSVSVSGYFKELMVRHELSPTEIFRRGIAVMLYDLGEAAYNSELNKLRSKSSKEFLKEAREIEKINKEVLKCSNLILTYKNLIDENKNLFKKIIEDDRILKRIIKNFNKTDEAFLEFQENIKKISEKTERRI